MGHDHGQCSHHDRPRVAHSSRYWVRCVVCSDYQYLAPYGGSVGVLARTAFALVGSSVDYLVQ